MITKQAENRTGLKRILLKHPSARNAWADIIKKHLTEFPNTKVFLPGYIGRSVNEGSGIFDPVLNSELDFEFYPLNENLIIDFEAFKRIVGVKNNNLVLLVHYFGFPDVNYSEVTEYLTTMSIDFVEDCAHAWLSDIIGGICGRNGMMTFYSFHKLLPINGGGALVINSVDDRYSKGTNNQIIEFNDYDLFGIYEIRRNNYKYLISLLKNIPEISFLHEVLVDGVCPQTLPIRLLNHNRDEMYSVMNAKGFGMVSLYHTMIQELDSSDSMAALTLSKEIINFPIHQDVSLKDLEEMVKTFKYCLGEC
jgi:dTDP-4-amino-4,6-dideoxygalactose transaminase